MNPALLFFDRIGVIAPQDVRGNDLFDRRTRLLIDNGLIEPIWPGHHYQWGVATDEIFLEQLRRRYRSHSRTDNYSRLHVGKLNYSPVLQGLAHASIAHQTDGWIFLPSWMASEIMAYFAIQICMSPTLNMSLVTDGGKSWSAVSGRAVEDAIMDRRLRAVASLLPVAGSVETIDIVDFREQHRTQLRRFQRFVTDLIVNSNLELRHDAQFEVRLNEAEELKRELVRRMDEANLLRAAGRISLLALPLIGELADGGRYGAMTQLPALANLLWQEVRVNRDASRVRHEPLAYAAISDRELR